MSLFKRMKHPVRGIGKVVSEMPPTNATRGSIRLIVTADGVPPTPVEYSVMSGTYRHLDRWPRDNDVIPVTVDRANPQSFTIEWSEMPKVADRLRQADDQREQQVIREMQAELRGEPPPADAAADYAQQMKEWEGKTRQLGELRDSGKLSEADYKKRKQQLLGELAEIEKRFHEQKRESASSESAELDALKALAGTPDPGALRVGLDVNNADASAIATVPEIGGDLAARIVQVRDRAGGFSSLEDLGMLLDLPGDAVERLRGRFVFLPRDSAS